MEQNQNTGPKIVLIENALSAHELILQDNQLLDKFSLKLGDIHVKIPGINYNVDPDKIFDDVG